MAQKSDDTVKLSKRNRERKKKKTNETQQARAQTGLQQRYLQIRIINMGSEYTGKFDPVESGGRGWRFARLKVVEPSLHLILKPALRKAESTPSLG